MKEVDFLIVGQGIAGSLLAYELIHRGQQVMVFDQDRADRSSSYAAAGLYNPITGRKMVKTWMADELFPLIAPYYDQLERALKASFHQSLPIYRPFISIEEQNDWQGKAGTEMYAPYVHKIHTESIGYPAVVDPFGGLSLNYTGVVDLPKALKAIKDYLQNKGMYKVEVFQYQNVKSGKDQVHYGDWRARAVIFCEGTGVADNPFFKGLKMRPVKGELIDIKTEFRPNQIVNRGVFMIPREGVIRVGSTYNNQDLSWQPTTSGISMIEDKLGKLYEGAYEVVRAFAGVRPATFDRRPFLGLMKNQPSVGIFNGLGTKGVSLAPYFAPMMANFLLGEREILPTVDVNRGLI
ncbi:MAG: FAD-dependent oxidoreductase [Cytophagales bacterium]|nr:FAD-dependent oxidoreductase [Cytophagales bacterium]